MVDYSLIGDRIFDFVSLHGMKIFVAIAVLIIGWIVINIFAKVLNKRFSKSKVIDPSLEHFLVSLISVSLKVLLIITVISMVGVQVTSFIAVLGAAGLAVGLALQGSLSNFAGGVLILTLRPFEVGDFIEAQGYSGKVSEIHVFNTILKTTDNKTVILPNGAVSNGNIVNFTHEKIRRVDMVFGIGYSDNIDKAKKIIEDLIKKDKRIIKKDEDHPNQVVISNLGDSSVDITTRVWTSTEEYWNVKFDMTENVKKEFDKKKVSIPFPQRDVHMYKGK
jgi:small conductance mechanosensitive channel